MLRTTYGDHQRCQRDVFLFLPRTNISPATAARRDEDGLLPDHRPGRRRAQRFRPPYGDRRGGKRLGGPRSAVAEAAVVGFPHDIKGTGIFAYVILTPEVHISGRRRAWWTPYAKVSARCRDPGNRTHRHTGPYPDHVPGLAQDPLRQDHAPHPAQDRCESEYDALGDVTTLADPNRVVEALVSAHKASS